ncbi:MULTISPECIES: FmdB family zinc ribbon protein [unclassified Curtobacterium]|uniref:FmdB family zinc ribbon protein n=1 Tax=unclassified Curtobacterium TaxID=257496 RepID=UPI00188A0B0C|nr:MULTISPECIES: FmdB family zinc ribbon protein [unclassified Curtobacterium]MBF4591933.1 FmdB family transcriptional regulator [Curtobacterium sp. VKM Ac-1395]MCY1693066.1 FmdB family transcriptional regulator [Curtobacterium sp. SL109]
MPTYSYRCTECGTAFDIKQSFSDATLTECPTCGGVLRKVFSPVGVTFNGGGFYRTDSRPTPKGEGSGSLSSSGSSSSDAKPAAAKPASGSSSGSSSSGSSSSGSSSSGSSSSGSSSSGSSAS